MFLLRLGLGLILLTPALAYAQARSSLEIPGNGDGLSGIGVISGWKCEATGEITVRFDGGPPQRMVYGSDRGDTYGVCGDVNNGFLAIWNWSLLADGQHTAVAYDNGVEFDRSTFTVASTGVEFLEGARARVRASDFPRDGDVTWLEWNENTQSMQITDTVEIGDVCQLMPEQVPVAAIETPLLLPPPLPCPRDRQGAFDGEGWYIQFEHDRNFDDRTCSAIRGTTQGTIREGKLHASTRARPHGRIRISGEVCADNGFYIGQWTVDGHFAGVFHGGLYEEECPGIWQDTAGCSGTLDIFEIPRREPD